MQLNKYHVVVAFNSEKLDFVVLGPEYWEECPYQRMVSENYMVVISGVGVYEAWYDRSADHLSDSLYASDNDGVGLPDELVEGAHERIKWATEQILQHARTRK